MPSDTPKTLDIRVATPIKAAPEKVYRALISARELCVWWLDRAETESRNMGRFRLMGSSGTRAVFELSGVFADLEPGAKAAYLLDAGSQGKDVPLLITFFMEEEGRASRLTVIHAGFPAAAAKRKIIERWRSLWEDAAAKLKLYLEKGVAKKGRGPAPVKRRPGRAA